MKYAGFQIDTISEKVEWEEDRELYKDVLGNYLRTEDSLRHTDKSFLPVNRIQLLKVKDKPLLIRNFAEKQMMAEVYGSYESANTFFLPEIGHIYQEGDLIRFSGLVYKKEKAK